MIMQMIIERDYCNNLMLGLQQSKWKLAVSILSH